MKDLVAKLVSGEDLTESEAGDLLEYLTGSDCDPVLAGAALAALRAKGESADELRGFAMGLRSLAVRPDIDPGTLAVDVVGTGGDGSGSFNLSTASSLLAAAAGIPVVKHGNRSISSDSGSADVLAALGMDLPWGPERAGEVFERTGFTFLFAPAYHPAMKAVAPIRQSLGIRTIFNLAGPLSNPATPPFAVLGVYSLEAARMFAQTLSGMPVERAYVVHGEPGWDEPTPVGPYHLLEVSAGLVVERQEDPSDFGIERADPADLVGGTPEVNAAAMRSVFAGEAGPHRDAVLLGAALAARVTGLVSDPIEALDHVSRAIDDGRAMAMLAELSEAARV